MHNTFYLKPLHKIKYFFTIITVGLKRKVKILWEKISVNDSNVITSKSMQTIPKSFKKTKQTFTVVFVCGRFSFLLFLLYVLSF